MAVEQSPQPAKAKRGRRRALLGLAAAGAVFAFAGLVLGILATHAALSPDDPPETTYQKILAAYGGIDSLDRWRCGVVEYESVIDLDVAAGRPGTVLSKALVTETFSLPNSLRYDIWTTKEPGTRLLSFGTNGEVTWEAGLQLEVQSRPGGPLGETAYPAFLRYFHPHFMLRGGVDISVAGVEHRAGGERDLIVVSSGSPPTTCRVDMRTKLLREARGLAQVAAPFDTQGAGRLEYGDYRKTEGGMIPGRITGYIGERKCFEWRFISVDFRDNISPLLFDPPQANNQP